jgi:hypothetical protein
VRVSNTGLASRCFTSCLKCLEFVSAQDEAAIDDVEHLMAAV